MAGKKNTIDLIGEVANSLLTLMGTGAKATVSKDQETSVYKLDIESKEEAGLLIGKRGETLNSFQHLVSLIVKQKLGEWVRIVADIGDWRGKQEDYLRDLAIATSERVKQTGKPEFLYNLTSAQRRIIHLELSGDSEVETESLGEGRERYLVVKPKGK